MSITIGSELATYKITALLGKGGMGEVYRARDSKLKRDVAIKVLPDGFSRDAERLVRFQREAELLASLNHPNIAAIYDLAGTEYARFLVLELVEGETLAARIAGGPIPIADALQIAQKIAEALEAAHEKGIVHRDLKPANIKITPDGKVKVLDFGLAKAQDTDSAAEDPANSPTLSELQTAGGVILGTASYMSPEQAKGKPADARSDIWAFGSVLFEMLTGKRMFGGESAIEILGGVLKAEPDWTALPAATPSAIRSLLRRCLQKDRSRRLRDIADARYVIEEALSEPGSLVPTVTLASGGRERMMWVAALLVAVGIIAVMFFRTAPSQGMETRLQIVTGPTTNLAQFAISPDGRSVVFQATTKGKTELWLRSLASDTAQPIPDTEDASYPFWSPDSRTIAFFNSRNLMRKDIAGGTAQKLADAPSAVGSGAWSPGGVILFNPASNGPLRRVSVASGQSMEATRVDPPRSLVHRYPRFLPDGQHFLFYAAGTPEGRGVYVGSLDSLETRRLFDADSAAEFAPPNYVLFVRQDALLAQRTDLGKMEPVGDPFPVAERVAGGPLSGLAALSVSKLGSLAYRTTIARAFQLKWFDRSGTVIGSVGDADTQQSDNVRLSRDGRTVAISRVVAGNRDVWLIEARGVRRHFTSDPEVDCCPLFSPDGSRIVFTSRRTGLRKLYEKIVDGENPEVLLLGTQENVQTQDWSSDGRFILYFSASQKTRSDLWVLPTDGDKKEFPIAAKDANERNGRFSPDVHWIAYESDETGRYEIYVKRFPGPGRNWQVSNSGGTDPRWGRDGKEVIYVGPNNRMMSVPIVLPASGSNVEPGAVVPLFTTPSSDYAVSSDGQRFLINTPLEDVPLSAITVVQNWKPAK